MAKILEKVLKGYLIPRYMVHVCHVSITISNFHTESDRNQFIPASVFPIDPLVPSVSGYKGI